MNSLVNIAQPAPATDHDWSPTTASAEAGRSTQASGDAALERPEVRGKFLFAGDSKLWVRGVTYGTFRPDTEGNEYNSRRVVEQDFAQMVANGVNTVRVYSVPPRWLLDAAAERGLRVMVGLPWEQHVAFLEDRTVSKSIASRVRDGVRRCAGHPALLCYAVGNEIPASIVRWYGPRRVERFISKLCQIAKTEDPGCLVTYVNYPTTEYLELPFVDLLSFNVYLERQESLISYLKRLHNIAGPRPLLMAEIGLDSLSQGQARQADVLKWQLRTTFASGCCGAFVFSWTDDWHRGGHDIEGWKFGLTTRDRLPKPALEAVRNVFEDDFPSRERRWPRISVVVCSYNGEATIRDTLEGLKEIDYPEFELIVVDDGSTDQTATITRQFPVRLIQTPNRGLSCARNVGLENATGEIIAYTDDDARPDPHWLTFIALAFDESDHAGIGGPNIAPVDDGDIADCVANAPGGPVHVLLTDDVAEHIPGCNMAFRKECLQAIGGFDPRYRAAGDDVDICWQLQDRGWTIGFSPAAFVWHHRRCSIPAYWKQQVGYGRAEALLEEKWPEKYNTGGHVPWAGRLYGAGLTRPLGPSRSRIYHGTWGSALFQSVYEPAPGILRSLPLMPEWYLLTCFLALLAALGAFWPPLSILVLPLAVAIVVPVAQALLSAAAATATDLTTSRVNRLKPLAVTAMLHLIQPAARLLGRLRQGLTPWRGRRHGKLTLPRQRKLAVWSEHWRSPEEWLTDVKARLRQERMAVVDGGGYDRWDLAVRGGCIGGARLLMAVEDHGASRQYVRFRLWPTCSRISLTLTGVVAVGAAVAARDGAVVAAVVLGALWLVLAGRTIVECSIAEVALLRALPGSQEGKCTAAAGQPAGLPWQQRVLDLITLR
jgi:O-antigen biosynthesis protein